MPSVINHSLHSSVDLCFNCSLCIENTQPFFSLLGERVAIWIDGLDPDLVSG